MRAIRGAICARANTKDAIYDATQHLLREIVSRNRLRTADVVAALFTMTPDLNADFPAYAARAMGWSGVAMLGAQESLVPGAPERAIRVLVLVPGAGSVRHVYLGRAAAMRSDLAEPGDAESWDAVPVFKPASTDERAGRALVVGLGLIGGSVAAAARQAALFDVLVGYDADPAAAGLAKERALIDVVGTELTSELAAADLVILATPVGQIVRLLRQYREKFRPGAVVTDVGSTKRTIVEAMSALPVGVRAVGGHPLTGGTERGPGAALPDLFRGARWVLVETERSDAEAIALVERLVRGCGATPVKLGAERHDEIIGVVSHLPLLMSVALLDVAASAPTSEGPPLFGPGFVGASRLAAGDPVMGAEMLADNADEVGHAVRRAVEVLEELARAVGGSRDGLVERLGRARSARAERLRELDA